VDYKVVTKQTEEGVSVWVPGLPGCWSEGKDEAEALENIQDAIADYLIVADQIARRDSDSKLHTVHVKVA